MKISSLFRKLNYQPLAMLMTEHRALLANLNTIGEISASSLDDLFEAPAPIFEEVGNCAIININGIIFPSATKFEKMLGATSCKDIRTAIKSAQSAKCENVIININSVGGVVQGVEETAKIIKALGTVKNTYAYSDEVCASAAYWLASQCNVILASESAQVGSIGVYLAILTFEKQLEQAGIEANIFKAGKYKTLGIASKNLTEEEKTYLQDSVNKTYQTFLNYLSHRKLDIEKTCQGEVFDGQTAASLNLIDGIQNDYHQLIDFLS